MKGRLMALDYGSKRIGVALSDPLRVLARGWGVVPRDPEGEAHFAAIAAIIAEEAVTGLVLGLPRNADGSEGEMVELVRAFGSRLAELTGLELAYCDESFSSLEADEILRCAEQSLDDWTNPDARALGLREVLHFIVLTQHVRERRAGTAVDLDLLLRRLVPDDL